MCTRQRSLQAAIFEGLPFMVVTLVCLFVFALLLIVRLSSCIGGEVRFNAQSWARLLVSIGHANPCCLVMVQHSKHMSEGSTCRKDVCSSLRISAGVLPAKVPSKANANVGSGAQCCDDYFDILAPHGHCPVLCGNRNGLPQCRSHDGCNG